LFVFCPVCLFVCLFDLVHKKIMATPPLGSFPLNTTMEKTYYFNLEDIAAAIKAGKISNVVVVTGAGISTSAGL